MQEQMNPRESMADLYEFGNMLSKKRVDMGKSRREMALICKVSGRALLQWENATNFPGRDKLPTIAKGYQIDLKELTQKFEISKSVREKEKAIRRTNNTTTRKVKLDEEILHGHIDNRRNLIRTNEQVPNFRLGRK